MTTPSILFLDASTLNRNDLNFDILHRLGNATLFPTSSPQEGKERLAQADIAITNKFVIDADILANCSKLRFIAVSATGTNNVDLAAAKKYGVRVANVPTYGTTSVAQHALAMMLNWATQMHLYAREPSAWAKSPIFVRLDYPVFQLSGKSLGLVGTGRIGKEVGRLAEAFGMTVRALKRDGSAPPEDSWPRLPLRELFSISEVISLHCPLTEQTRHLIHRETLGWMKPGAFLINTGRGDLVDEIALKEALLTGKLGGAGLDVLSKEPPPPDHPLLDPKIPNLILTPHTAWTAKEARICALNEVASNIEAFLKGNDRNRVA